MPKIWSAAKKAVLDHLDSLIQLHHCSSILSIAPGPKAPFRWSPCRPTPSSIISTFALPRKSEQLSAAAPGSSPNSSTKISTRNSIPPRLTRSFAVVRGIRGRKRGRARASWPFPGIAALLDTFDEIASQGHLCRPWRRFMPTRRRFRKSRCRKSTGCGATTRLLSFGRWPILPPTKRRTPGTPAWRDGSREKE